MKFFKLYIFLFIIVLSNAQITERFHPELNWKKFKTEHFDIVFHEGTERSAKHLAEIAEEIYLPVTKTYNYQPKKRITWVVKDIDDYSNGGAYFLDHKIEIWTEHLDYDLRGTHDWLRNVVTHEFIHMIHIQKSFTSSLTIPFALLQWIGYEKERRKDVVRGFPNVLFNYPQLLFRVPAWLAEGVAQHQVKKMRHDYRDSHREMVLRDRFLNNNVLSLEEMSTFGKTTIGNESSYNQGYSLVNYIVNRFGESVLEKISDENAKWSSLIDYNGVFERATGVNLDQLYDDWKTDRVNFYTDLTKTISTKNTTKAYIHSKGEANFYPKYSPNGGFIAYTTSEGSRRFSKNKLILYNQKTKTKIVLSKFISSQIEWFNDGTKLLYSKQTEPDQWGSHFNDLYYYDLILEKEVRLTKNCRARNATINSKNEIVFVSAYDGTTNLMRFTLGEETYEFTLNQKERRVEHSTEKSNTFGIRNSWVRGTNPTYITQFKDGTQFFHPTFKSDSVIVTDLSNGYLRHIDELNIYSNSQKTLVSGDNDYRNPVIFGNDIYFSSDESGIFNIYKNSLQKPITNALGGAFMPSVSSDKLLYSEYSNGAYKIAEKNISVEDVSSLKYTRTSEMFVSKIKPTKLQLNEIKTERVGYNFNSYYIVPRVFVDDKHPKFGAIVIVNELLNKSIALLGASYNARGERDIFGLFEFRNFSVFGFDPTFFVEAYNQTTKIDDRIDRKFGEFQREIADREVEFSLWQYEAGFKLKLWNQLDFRLAFINSRYHASLSPAAGEPLKRNGDDFQILYPFIRYNYHLGNSLETRFLMEQKDPSVTGEIAPKSGFRFFTRGNYNKNKFLDKFSTNTGFLLEEYKKYNYLNLYFKGAYHFPGIFKGDGVSLNITSEGNFSDTDEFYDIYAGGWIGLKGYPYFSMHGRHMFQSSLYYTKLLGSDLKLNTGIIRLRNIAFSAFGEIGDAWSKGDISLKRDIGFQIKADTYGPLKVLFEGAYPFDEPIGKQRNSEGNFEPVVYTKAWRYYFMLSYDFGLMDIL